MVAKGEGEWGGLGWESGIRRGGQLTEKEQTRPYCGAQRSVLSILW